MIFVTPTESDDDLETSLAIYRVLAVHLARIFDELTSKDYSRSTTVVNTAKRKVFSALLDEFDRYDYLEAAVQANAPPSTAEKWIRAFCDDEGPVEKVAHRHYRNSYDS